MIHSNTLLCFFILFKGSGKLCSRLSGSFSERCIRLCVVWCCFCNPLHLSVLVLLLLKLLASNTHSLTQSLTHHVSCLPFFTTALHVCCWSSAVMNLHWCFCFFIKDLVFTFLFFLLTLIFPSFCRLLKPDSWIWVWLLLTVCFNRADNLHRTMFLSTWRFKTIRCCNSVNTSSSF